MGSVETGHANKSLKHVGVMDHRLAGRDGKRDFEAFAGRFRQIDIGYASKITEILII